MRLRKLINYYDRKDFRVVTVGGFGGFIREYKKEIEKKNLKDYFIFLNFQEKVAPVMKMFDILLIPSLGEACPLVPMEGLICGNADCCVFMYRTQRSFKIYAGYNGTGR